MSKEPTESSIQEALAAARTPISAAERALQEAARQALMDVGFVDPDPTAIEMVNLAVRLLCDSFDHGEPISTDHLFVAAVSAGAGASSLYSAALATVVGQESAFSRTYRLLVRRFTVMPADVALKERGSPWFDPDLHSLLQIATREAGDFPASDAIVRTLLRSPSSLGKDMQFDRLALAVEAQIGRPKTSPPPASVME